MTESVKSQTNTKNINRQYSGCRRFVLRTIFFLLYAGCYFLAAKKGAVIELFGATLFLTLAINIPAKAYVVMFSRYGVYEKDSPQGSWIICKIASIIYKAKGEGRDAFVTLDINRGI